MLFRDCLGDGEEFDILKLCEYFIILNICFENLIVKCLYNFDILNFFLLFEQFLDGVFYFDIDNIVDYWISGVINEEKIMKNKNFSYIENF